MILLTDDGRLFSSLNPSMYFRELLFYTYIVFKMVYTVVLIFSFPNRTISGLSVRKTILALPGMGRSLPIVHSTLASITFIPYRRLYLIPQNEWKSPIELLSVERLNYYQNGLPCWNATWKIGCTNETHCVNYYTEGWGDWGFFGVLNKYLRFAPQW